MAHRVATACPPGVKIGVPTEVKNHEYRVALTPAGVHELTGRGHEVLVQRGAGAGSSLPDAEFVVAPGSGHLALMEDPELTNDALRRMLERSVIYGRGRAARRRRTVRR